METMGRVFTVLGDYESAEPLLDRAVVIRTEYAGEDELALAESLYHQANLFDEKARYDEAETAVRRAIEIRRRITGDDPTTASYFNTLGNVLWHQGRLDEAEVEHRRALEIREETLPPYSDGTAQSLHNLGALRYFAADYDEAERLYRRSIEIEEATGGRENHHLATSLHTLAIVYQDQDRFEEALQLELESLEIREKVLGSDHPHVALSLTTLGNIYRSTDQAAEGEPLIRRALRIGENTYGIGHGEVWWMQRSLVSTLLVLERFDDADVELVELEVRVSPSDDPSEKAAVHELRGELYADQYLWNDAVKQYQTAITLVQEDSPDSPWVGYSMTGLARVYRDAGLMDEAKATYRRAIELMRDGWGADDVDCRRAADELAEIEGTLP